MALQKPLKNNSKTLLSTFKTKLNAFKNAQNTEYYPILACSGGMDSMVLATLLLHTKTPFTLCHVHHNQRKSAEKDLKLVQNWAKAHQIPLKTLKLRLKPGASEDLLRKHRRQALLQTACLEALRTGKTPVVLTAHHANDQLETYLFKLLRGAHPESINGIPETIAFEKTLFFRPLLSFSKEQLLGFAKEKKIKWATDPTNRNLKFSRNKIRHKLIPLLEDLRPQSSQKVLRFFETLQAQKESVENSKLTQCISVDRLTSSQGVPITNTRLVDFKTALSQLLGDLSQRTVWSQWANVERALAERRQSKTGGGPKKTFQFPGGYELFFEKNRAFLRRKIPTKTA